MLSYMNSFNYDHRAIEKRWQEKWQEEHLYHTDDASDKEKYYVLDMFPYPSGEGLHVGHPKGYIATDVFSRLKRMQGKNVLHPMGWDAFGLPAENYAIKNKVHPREAVERNIARYKEQLSVIGFDYDWSREVNTTDPAYYKWTQWIFVQLFKKGLAYESHEPINWCPSCLTGLANEDLEDGKCERCGSVVEQKPIRQWVLKIREYADRLLEDLDGLNWPNSIKESQKNWIGKKTGINLHYKVDEVDETITCFTTRPDTNFGATFVTLAPEHPFVEKYGDSFPNSDAVKKYVEKVKNKTDFEREVGNKEKTGVATGWCVTNQLNGKKLPIYIGDFVLAHFGTGAVVGVPGHDLRDFEFAQKMDIEIVRVVVGEDGDTSEITLPEQVQEEAGTMVNSGFLDGEEIMVAKDLIMDHIEKQGWGEKTVNYRLQDWVFSRQRYWGEPIPVIHCEKCGPVAVPESELPVTLPNVEHYEPTGTGESPLANIEEWVNTTCPECNGAGKRETNTMPQWAGSSWYYLRYMDNKNNDALVDPEKEKYWQPVDMYVGGAEHATRHLIYARFWHKFLHDIGVVSGSEPFTRLQHVGLIQAEDGRKMSKRYGNVINPDEIVETYGADTLRVYEMFMGPFDQNIGWSTKSIIGPRRFLERVGALLERVSDGVSVSDALETEMHRAIKKVGEDIEAFRFNTAISTLMALVNSVYQEEQISKEYYKTLVQLLAPFAPHITEELWSLCDGEGSVHTTTWPVFDESKTISDEVTIAVQVDGKVRDTFSVARDSDAEEVKKMAQNLPKVAKWLEEGDVEKVIYVPGKLVNIVVTNTP